MSRLSVRPAGAYVLFFGCACAWGCDAVSSALHDKGDSLGDSLVVEELRSWPLPPGVEIVRGWIADDSTVVVWSQDGAAWRFGRSPVPDRLLQLDGVFLPPRGRSSAAGWQVELSDVQRSLACLGEPTVAGLAQNGDYLATLSAPKEGLQLVSVYDVGGMRCDRLAEPFEAPATWGPSIRALPADHDFLVGFADGSRTPWRIWVADGTVTISNAPGFGVVIEDPERFTIEPKWALMPLLALDRGLLKMTADIRSDWRLIELLDDEGSAVRSTWIEAQVGFAATWPTRRLILGMRGDPRREITLSRWSWVAGAG